MRLIDADEVMRKANDSFKSAGLHGEDFRKFKRWVNKSPTVDAVEIVRCGNCDWWNRETKGCKRNPSVGPWWEDDFCSYGEREDK